jgi:hypothetical protein
VPQVSPIKPLPTRDTEIEFWPRASEAQRRFRDAVVNGRAKVCAFLGGIGSGKTAVGSIVALELAAHYAAGRTAGIITPSYRTFWQVTVPELRKWWPLEDKLWSIGRPDGQPAIVVHTPHGASTIHIRSAQDAGTIEEIRGPTWAWFWGDEVGSWGAREAAHLLAIGRLRDRLKGCPLPRTVAFYTGSPRWWMASMLGIPGRMPPQAWTTGYYASGTSPDDAVYVQASRTEANTNNADGYASFLRLQYGEAFAQQELDGDFVPPAGAVFPGFVRAIHVVPDAVALRLFERTARRVGGVDWGFATTGALVVAGIDGDNRFVIPPEGSWAQAGVSVDARGAIARQWIDRFGSRGPAGQRSLTWYVPPDNVEAVSAWQGRLHDRAAVPGTEKARNARDEGWDSVRNLMRCTTTERHPCDDASLLERDRRPASWIYIAESNVKLISDIQGLQYKPVKPGQDPPEDDVVGDDHLPDALRYMVYSALYGATVQGHRARERR